MSLRKSNTRFNSLRGTPESDDESNGKRSLRAVPGNDSSDKLRKRSLPNQDNEAPLEKRPQSQGQAGTGFNGLHIPQAVHSKAGSVGNVRMKHSLLWESLRKDFYLRLEDSVVIASQKDGRFVAVREFSGPHADRKVNMLQRIQGKNFQMTSVLKDLVMSSSNMKSITGKMENIYGRNFLLPLVNMP
jgi:hypothetical protein